MKTQFWLSTNKAGSVNVRKTKPNNELGYVSMLVNLELPDALFEQPQLQASLSIPQEKITTTQINMEVIDNVEQVLKTTTGIDFKISVVDPEERMEDVDEEDNFYG